MNTLCHGNTEVLLHNNIIEAVFSGSFNVQGIESYIGKVKGFIASLDGAPFAMLIDDRAVEGGTPEAYDALNAYNDWLNSQALVAKAFVFDSVITKSILIKRTPALEQQNIEFFEHIDEARAWLHQQLKMANEGS